MLDENTGKPSWSRNGNKEERVYSGSEIIDIMLPRFIGYSLDRLKAYGTDTFSADREMCSVWRFIYKRSVLQDNGITFPKGVVLREDVFFNCHFFCFAKRISVISDVLYTYMQKSTGLMYSSINNAAPLIKSKMDGIAERSRLRRIYDEQHGVDIFGMYAGSLVLSALELIVRLRRQDFRLGKNAISDYMKNGDVQYALKQVHLLSLPVKLFLPILFLRANAYLPLYSMVWLPSRINSVR